MCMKYLDIMVYISHIDVNILCKVKETAIAEQVGRIKGLRDERS